MKYSITNQANQDWLNRSFQPNTSLIERNENYHFLSYSDPILALLLDQTQNPKVWEIETFGTTKNYGDRSWSESITIIKELETKIPTQEQIIAFGLVAALSTVTNKIFSDWAINWLRNIRSTEETEKVSQHMLTIMDSEFVHPAHAALASTSDPSLAPHAALRAFYDSQEPLDLLPIAQIVTTLSLQEIGDMFAGIE